MLKNVVDWFLCALQNISNGTIPYLGTFLTDLTMIDTAIPDTVADGLINFDKRRKEFEVLAQVSCLGKWSCTSSVFPPLKFGELPFSSESLVFQFPL
jgi:hypothetical protein